MDFKENCLIKIQKLHNDLSESERDKLNLEFGKYNIADREIKFYKWIGKHKLIGICPNCESNSIICWEPNHHDCRGCNTEFGIPELKINLT